MDNPKDILYARIAGSNHDGGIDFCLLWVLYVIR